MKRRTFTITWPGGTATKHAWNSAIRETENLIRAIAQQEAATYRLTDKESVRVGFKFAHGSRTWTGHNGRIIRFDVRDTTDTSAGHTDS